MSYEAVVEKLVETGLAVNEREVVPRAGKSGEKDFLAEEEGDRRDVLVPYGAVIEKLVETGLAVNERKVVPRAGKFGETDFLAEEVENERDVLVPHGWERIQKDNLRMKNGYEDGAEVEKLVVATTLAANGREVVPRAGKSAERLAVSKRDVVPQAVTSDEMLVVNGSEGVE